MHITETRVKLVNDSSGSNDRLRAFCGITIDGMFVTRDIKIIEGSRGLFIAMPSRKIADHCHTCGTKNHLLARFCNQCGCRLAANRAPLDDKGKPKIHADIAHPINRDGRHIIEEAVLEAYEAELQSSRQPGYSSRYDDYEVTADDVTREEVNTVRLVARKAVG